ncbi:MAG: penicillin-binding protein 2 [Rickettsiales bacterium]|jgi:cell division protein FtsI (penicillin-binding protein 3)|nr:penicillin-binding protein 2 [Rickettsiales bacterium]
MFEVGRDIARLAKNPPEKTAGLKRLRFIHIIVLVCIAIFAGRTLYLGAIGIDARRYDTNAATWVASRADIVDRSGDILAKNIMSGDIVLRPPLVRDADAVASLIHDVIPEISVSDALELTRDSRRFLYVKKLATERQRAQIKAAKIPGLDAEEVEQRRYPKRRMFSHVIGFVGAEMNGLEGVEKTRDKYLSENTDALVLSVDSRVQAAMYSELAGAVQKYSALGAMGILMNSRTGEIIAMVSLPDFDPENIKSDADSNRMFRPSRGVFEMGSIFKIFNTAMAIENGIGLDHRYYVGKPFQVMARGRVAHTVNDVATFKPFKIHADGKLSVAEIMVQSCNAGSAQIALDLSDGVQQEFFRRLKMDQALDLEFGRTERPLWPQKWGPVERATISYGHGMSVTPMHTLLAVNALVNGGIYIEPTLFKRGAGAVTGTRVVDAKTSAELRKIMFDVAETTSARAARVAGINVGGKTATAEKWFNGKIDRRRNLTAFVGAFPIESPQYTILIVLDEPKGTEESWGLRTAAWNAVPTAGKILDSVLPMLF